MQRALPIVERALSIAPADPNLHRILGTLHAVDSLAQAELGDLTLALAALDRAEAEMPLLGEAQLSLARCALALARASESPAALEDRAVAALGRAAAAGLADPRALADSDFDAVRDHPDFPHPEDP